MIGIDVDSDWKTPAIFAGTLRTLSPTNWALLSSSPAAVVFFVRYTWPSERRL
jgi:hypothetical protein